MKEIEIEADGVRARLTLRRANMGDDMRRSMLAANALQNPLPDPAEQTVAVVIYPRCVACVVKGEVDEGASDDGDQGRMPCAPTSLAPQRASKPARELTAAEFVALPFEIGEAWLTAALELNPGWSLTAPTQEQEDAAKKKE